MKSLANIQAFVQVAKHKSFTEAAGVLGLSPSAVSKSVQRLEDHLNLKLLHRTTRKLSLTDDGERFYLRAAEILDELGYLEAEVSESKAELSGRLRVNCPVTLGRHVMVGPITSFLQRHPDLKAEVRFDDKIIDLAEEGVDVAVRTGQLNDSTNLIVTGFFHYQTVLCASPDFVRRWGAPSGPADMSKFPSVGFAIRSVRRTRAWNLTVNGQLTRVPVEPYFVLEDLTALAQAVEAGAGIGLLPSWSCLDSLRSGAIVEILPELRPPTTPVWLAYHDRRHPSAKIRRFVDDMKSLSSELTFRYCLQA